MSFRQTPVTHTPYGLVSFDKNGKERSDDPEGINGLFSARLLASVQELRPTDVFLFSHGWKGDVDSAVDQYNRWIDAMARLNADISRMGPGFRPLWIGLHWPSQPWGNESLGTAASFAVEAALGVGGDQLEDYLDRLNLSGSLKARELMAIIFRENRLNPGAVSLSPNVAAAYNELADLIGYESKGAGADPAADNAPFDANSSFAAMNSTGFSFGGGFLGGILGPLRQLTFWMMKKRARTVGEVGMHDFILQLQTNANSLRIHLMGHSFGTIVVSSIIGGPGGTTPLLRPIDSLVLIQGAVSLWCYADSIPSTGGRGYFNSMYHRPGVSGPIVTTRSTHDLAVNIFYPASTSMVLQSPSFGINPSLIIWGAIGAFGIQGIPGVVDQRMLPETADYHFGNNIYNLEASEFIKKMDGVSGAHSDIDGPQVAHAIWQAALVSASGAATSAEPVLVNATAVGGAAVLVVEDASPAPPPRAGTAPAPTVLKSSPAPITDKEMPITFGIQAETGAYLPPIKPRDLDHIDRDSQAVDLRRANLGKPSLAPTAEVDAENLAATGWGVVFPSGIDGNRKAAIKSALKPLLDLRSSQAGDLFRIFEEATGILANESAEQWLNRMGSGFATVDPNQGVPYYLMLVGSPTEIPFTFQYDLDVFFGVGRIVFESPAEYAQYAQNIVDFERSGTPQPKNIAIYCTRNDGDVATGMLHDQVASPLAAGAGAHMKALGANLGYSVSTRLADAATKSDLIDLLTNGIDGIPPALLFTGSHGVAFMPSEPNQRMKQGAILTQDWAGGPLRPNHYLTADEIPAAAKLHGAMHFFFACYSAGCPQSDTYSYGPDNTPVPIANDTFVARLPQKMLLSGAQAVIGHVDRAWAYSFQSSGGITMAQNFRDPMTRLLQGRRIGDAMDVFDQRWGALSGALANAMLRKQSTPGAMMDTLLANRWVARDDARNHIVLGDPAARLRLAEQTPGTGGRGPAVIGQPAAPAGGASFGIMAAAPVPAPVGAPSFGPMLSSKPVLHFRDFSSALEMKAGVSPDCSYQLVQAVLALAKQGSKIDVYIYSISAPYLMDLLQGALNVGASIRLMYDPNQMAKADAQKLANMGIDVKVAPSHDPRRVFTVCHQKFVVLDRKTVLIESANWAASSIPLRRAGEARKKGNREWLVRIDDEKVASWYADLFDADFTIPAQPGSFEVVAEEVLTPCFRAPRADAPRDFPIMNFSGQQMTVTPITSPDNYFDQILPLIRSAQNRIWIQQQYIEGSGGTSVPRLLDAVAQRGSGIDVKLIVSSKFKENWENTKDTVRDANLIDKLRAINLDNFLHCHNKGVIVDDAVVVSSTNWSQNSIRSAREAGILIHSPSVTAYFAQVFADDWRTGWSVATADAQSVSFDMVAGAAADSEVDPADRV